MADLVIDTSVWIEFFAARRPLPEVEAALREGRAILSPIVYAELLSGFLSPKKEKTLMAFLGELDLYPMTRSHWQEVGQLRRFLFRNGFSLTIPDVHLIQCAKETGGILYSFDQIFKKVSRETNLRLLTE